MVLRNVNSASRLNFMNKRRRKKEWKKTPTYLEEVGILKSIRTDLRNELLNAFKNNPKLNQEQVHNICLSVFKKSDEILCPKITVAIDLKDKNRILFSGPADMMGLLTNSEVSK